MDSSTSDVDSTRPSSKANTLSEIVIETVADADGVDPIELPPLYGTVDPDALDSLFHTPVQEDADSIPTGEVRFVYHGYEVRVTAGGEVSLADTATPRNRDEDAD